MRRVLQLTTIVFLVACTSATPAITNQTPAAGPRGGTLRVGIGNAPLFGLDPQREFSGATWELLRCCLLRTLMSYSDLDGQPATQPQPDLAAGPPTVSTDGTIWTFHLQPGLHYAPPLQDVPITSRDIVRALLRSGDHATGNRGLAGYFSMIDGFTAYESGKAETIAGLETPDPLTLRVRESHPDGTLPYAFAMAASAPIPPLPGRPDATYGVATGHPTTGGALGNSDGYGRFLVASGPYMIEGAGAMDFSLPPDQQQPAAGFTPRVLPKDYFETGRASSYGSITLVRNPSWDATTDPLRAALADRIVMTGGTASDLFAAQKRGDLDMVYDTPPPPNVVSRDLADPALRPLVRTTDGLALSMGFFNLAQPPFDDVAVRRAVADVIDRKAIAEASRSQYTEGITVLSTHLAPDPTEASLISGWNPFPTADGSPDLAAALQEMSASRYAKGDRCSDPSCDHVTVLVHPGLEPITAELRSSLARLGIHADIEVTNDFWNRCGNPRERIGICLGFGWTADLPDAGNFLGSLFAGDGPYDWAHLGMSPRELRRYGYPVTEVPSVDGDIERCREAAGSAKPACWASLDQYLTGTLVAAVPLVSFEPLRLSSPRLGAFAWTEAYGEPSLDRLPGAGT